MEQSPEHNHTAGFSEKEKIELNRITYAKNMIQMQIALRKGFDGSNEEKDPRHFFEKYSQAFGDMIKENTNIIADFYNQQNNLDQFLSNIELQLEEFLSTRYKH